MKALSKPGGLNYGWVVFGTLLLIDSMTMGVAFTLGLMLPSISGDLGIDLRQAGWPSRRRDRRPWHGKRGIAGFSR